jgi:hypothetical protein
MLFTVFIVIYIKDHIKQIRTPGDKPARFPYIQAGGTYIYHLDLNS